MPSVMVLSALGLKLEVWGFCCPLTQKQCNAHRQNRSTIFMHIVAFYVCLYSCSDCNTYVPNFDRGKPDEWGRFWVLSCISVVRTTKGKYLVKLNCSIMKSQTINFVTNSIFKYFTACREIGSVQGGSCKTPAASEGMRFRGRL